jgi:hypothetical protein
VGSIEGLESFALSITGRGPRRECGGTPFDTGAVKVTSREGAGPLQYETAAEQDREGQELLDSADDVERHVDPAVVATGSACTHARQQDAHDAVHTRARGGDAGANRTHSGLPHARV